MMNIVTTYIVTFIADAKPDWIIKELKSVPPDALLKDMMVTHGSASIKFELDRGDDFHSETIPIVIDMPDGEGCKE